MLKIRNFFSKYRSEMALAATIFAISIASFNLGRLNAARHLKQPMQFYSSQYETGGESSVRKRQEELKPDFRVVASKNSNKYHFSWCSGAKRIKAANLIEFENEAAAIAAGYVLAANCSK